MAGLDNIFLHVTKQCNLRCKYCYFSADHAETGEMTAMEYRRVLPDLVAARPKKIIFTGGEPLLRADLLTLLHDLVESDPRHTTLRCLNTNGHSVDESVARSLVGVVDEVRVSLDGMEERNDRLRGRGNFDAAVRAIRVLDRVGFEPKVLVTVTTESAPDLRALCLYLINDLGVTRININSFRPIGRGAGHSEWLPSLGDLDAIVDEFATGTPLLPPPLANKGDLGCGIGRSLNVTPTGDVYPCHVFMDEPFLLGNIRRTRLTDMQSSRTLTMLQLASREAIDVKATDKQSTRCLADVLRSGGALRSTAGLIQIGSAQPR